MSAVGTEPNEIAFESFGEVRRIDHKFSPEFHTQQMPFADIRRYDGRLEYQMPITSAITGKQFDFQYVNRNIQPEHLRKMRRDELTHYYDEVNMLLRDRQFKSYFLGYWAWQKLKTIFKPVPLGDPFTAKHQLTYSIDNDGSPASEVDTMSTQLNDVDSDTGVAVNTGLQWNWGKTIEDMAKPYMGKYYADTFGKKSGEKMAELREIITWQGGKTFDGLYSDTNSTESPTASDGDWSSTTSTTNVLTSAITDCHVLEDMLDAAGAPVSSGPLALVMDNRTYAKLGHALSDYSGLNGFEQLSKKALRGGPILFTSKLRAGGAHGVMMFSMLTDELIATQEAGTYSAVKEVGFEMRGANYTRFGVKCKKPEWLVRMNLA